MGAPQEEARAAQQQQAAMTIWNKEELDGTSTSELCVCACVRACVCVRVCARVCVWCVVNQV